jgi:hypothetical protein
MSGYRSVADNVSAWALFSTLIESCAMPDWRVYVSLAKRPDDASKIVNR